MLLIGTMAALLFMNSPWSNAFQKFWETPVGFTLGHLDFSRSLRNWITDGLMTFFFFLVALELKRELVLGELRSFRLAALPLAGAIGGMIAPALLYIAISHGRPEAKGWGVVMATDTSFVIGSLALLGSRIPTNLRLYLLSLAVFDDIGAILVVTLGYRSDLNWMALGFVALGIIIIAVASRIGMRSVPVYSILGLIVWLCFDASGIHTSIAGVILGLMTPARGWVSDKRLRAIFTQILSYPEGNHWSGDTLDRKDLFKAATAAKETLSPVERIELRLHPWVGFLIMPLFAFANAGVVFSLDALWDPVTLVVISGLVIGKPIGVFFMSWLSVRCGIARLFPALSWPLIAASSLLTGIGFTMSLFIAGLAFPPLLLISAKIGIIIASVISMTIGMIMLFYITSKSRTRLKANSIERWQE